MLRYVSLNCGCKGWNETKSLCCMKQLPTLAAAIPSSVSTIRQFYMLLARQPCNVLLSELIIRTCDFRRRLVLVLRTPPFLEPILSVQRDMFRAKKLNS